MSRSIVSYLFALLTLLVGGSGCGPTVDHEDIEGVYRSEDLLFRYVDYPEIAPDEAFLALERLLRLRFAGARLAIDREAMTIETEPRPFRDAPNRVTVYGQVSGQAVGARIELFAKIDRLRDDIKDAPESPWMYVGGDAELENQLFEELWDALVVRKRIDGLAPPAPTPAGDEETRREPNPRILRRDDR